MGRTNNIRAVAIIAGLAAALPGGANADDWKLEAGISAKETYTDNVALSSTNRQSDFITDLSPYITASKKGARFQADFRYAMQNLFYADQSSRNRINHQLAGRAKAELWENELFLDANASISQQLTSLLGPVGDTATAASNTTDVYTLSVSPYWQHRFGSTANLLARYTHGEVSSSGSSFANSSTDSINTTLSSGTAFNNWFWNLAYSDQQTNYSNRPDVKLSTVSGAVGYSITAKLRVNGTVGYDKNNYLYTGTTKPQGRFWSAGFSWAPTNRTTLSASRGERYFGKTYSLAFDHRTRRTTWHAAYAQDVTTTASQFTFPYGVSTFDYLYNRADWEALFPDPSQRATMVTLAILMNGWPLVLTDQSTVLTSQVYLNKRFDASVGYRTAKTVTTLSLLDVQRESQESGNVSSALYPTDIFAATNSTKQRGAQLMWLWTMNPRLSASIGLNLTRNEFPQLGRTDKLSVLSVGLTRTFNNQLTGSVNLRHQQRDSNVAGGEYRENALIGAVNYKF